MSKLWKLQPEVPEEISQNLGQYPKFFRQLLYNRGLLEKAEINDFVNPSYENLNSPFLFLDMQKAVNRIWQAIEKKEKITIYGDYDADAVTANAVLQQTFKYLGVDVESYIPDRFTEGYGINMEALEKIKLGGTKLIITVDCGTNSIDAADFCLENGIDFIITDHHEIIGEKPKSYALINPKNPDDTYPYSEIVGVGVAFKLACGILGSVKCKVKSEKWVQGYEKWLLDLVAIGTVADCHSLKGENRTLVKYGLKVLAKTKWLGLLELMKSAGVDPAKGFDTYTLGFLIAPRLNAAGRLEHASVALDLLMATDQAAAKEKAQALENINKRRQDITLRIVSEAREQALMIKDRKVLVLAGDWHKGVVGLVAGRLAEEFYRPVIVLEKTEEFSTGSARTVGDFNVVEALKFASEHLVRFGGHKQAAGLTLKTSEFDKFYQKILEYAEVEIKEEQLSVLNLEAELETAELSAVSCQLISKLEPFGVDNHKPKFLIKNLEILSLKPVGATGQHYQIQFKKEHLTISSIYFNVSNFVKNLKIGDTVDAAGELMLDQWNGRSILKLRIVDLRIS
jgi:single-stranded-DNA-specific exonuclease